MSSLSATLLRVKPEYLPRALAATWASISVRTLDRWRQAGLQYYQATPRSKVLIRFVDLEGFLARQRITQSDLDSMVQEVYQELLSDRVREERGKRQKTIASKRQLAGDQRKELNGELHSIGTQG